MGFTGVIGGAISSGNYSELANIEFAYVPGSSPPAFSWFPFELPFPQWKPRAPVYTILPTLDPALMAGYTPPPVVTPAYLFTLPPPVSRPLKTYSDAPSFPVGTFGGAAPATSFGWLTAPQSQVQRQPQRQSALSVLAPPLLPGYSPAPLPTPTAYAPLLTPVFQPGDFQRIRKNFEQLAQMLNNLMAKGYLERVSYNPLQWKINAPGSGVTNFNGRTGAITLTAADIIAALGPQNPNQVLAGPIPSFQFLGGTLFVGNGPPPASLGWQGSFYIDLTAGELYQFE